MFLKIENDITMAHIDAMRAEHFRAARKLLSVSEQKQLSQEKLAELLGVARNTIRRLENPAANDGTGFKRCHVMAILWLLHQQKKLDAFKVVFNNLANEADNYNHLHAEND